MVSYLTCEPSEREHADLLDNVGPATRSAVGLQRLVQPLTHGADTIRHCDQIVMPGRNRL